MMSHYNNSLSECLKYHYPTHAWEEWLFETAPHKFWKQLENQRRYLDWAAKRLGLKSMDEWYSVAQASLDMIGGT
jgi:hypothetical protein